MNGSSLEARLPVTSAADVERIERTMDTLDTDSSPTDSPQTIRSQRQKQQPTAEPSRSANWNESESGDIQLFRRIAVAGDKRQAYVFPIK